MLAPRLRETPGVTGLTEVREAFLPIISMTFNGVEFDLLLARISRKTVNEDLGNLLDDNIFRGCDMHSIRSLAGARDTNAILSLVPNRENFELVLRCIKLWSKSRGINENVMGYFGGITWALLVAKICIDNPYAAPNKLLARFFEFYRDYPWGE